MTERPDVEELARLLAEALPGEWLQGPPHVVRIEDRDEQGRKRTRFVAEMYATRGLPDTRAAHAALVAAAVNALPALLTRNAALEAELGASRNEAQGQYDLNVELIAKMAALEADLELARGAMRAQDEREQQAGARCGVPWEQHGCDWPDGAATEVLALRADLAAARTAMYSGDEAGVTCACRWEAMPKGAGASGPQVRECAEHLALREELAAARKDAIDAQSILAGERNMLAAAWLDRGERLPGADKQSTLQRVLTGIHELREAKDAAEADLAAARQRAEEAERATEVARLRAALHASRVNFREMAEDYPGSSFELWCHRAMAIIDAALKGEPPC